MDATQIALPFRMKKPNRRKCSNADLIGRSYAEDQSTVKVIAVCPENDNRVIVQRQPGGSTWTMPGWLMRLIFLEKKGKRAA